jgi:hydroxyacylglutathione hydrolase
MIVRQFYLESLGHASYLIGSEQTGEALVIDVRRDVHLYYDFAREQGLTIRYAADTHQHNDYLSGITELKQRSPVELLASARAELGYDARKMTHGEVCQLGEVAIEVRHTPGHTPEHVSFLVRDHGRGDEPVLLFSGGSLLVDDVARPDLLGSESEARAGARDLRRTLDEQIFSLPDHVLVYPTHVSGSLCGGNIGSMLVTTIGYERRLNQLARCMTDEGEFIDRCLDLKALPTVPPYWRRMRGQNQAGPPPLGVLSQPRALNVAEFAGQPDRGAVILDCRQPEAFGGGHVPGALNVGYGPSFSTWAGSVLAADRPVALVLERSADLWEITWQLLRIGYDVPVGWLSGGMMAWRVAGRPIERTPQWTVDELHERMNADNELLVLDVRQPAEWLRGHVPGATHIPGGELPGWPGRPGRIDEIDVRRSVAVYCGSGYRSSVAASLLQARQQHAVYNVLGGFAAWRARDLPMERP